MSALQAVVQDLEDILRNYVDDGPSTYFGHSSVSRQHGSSSTQEREQQEMDDDVVEVIQPSDDAPPCNRNSDVAVDKTGKRSEAESGNTNDGFLASDTASQELSTQYVETPPDSANGVLHRGLAEEENHRNVFNVSSDCDEKEDTIYVADGQEQQTSTFHHPGIEKSPSKMNTSLENASSGNAETTMSADSSPSMESAAGLEQDHVLNAIAESTPIKRGKGRPRKYPKGFKQSPSGKPRGRPRIYPLPDCILPDIPKHKKSHVKRGRGRPRNDPPLIKQPTVKPRGGHRKDPVPEDVPAAIPCDKLNKSCHAQKYVAGQPRNNGPRRIAVEKGANETSHISFEGIDCTKIDGEVDGKISEHESDEYKNIDLGFSEIDPSDTGEMTLSKSYDSFNVSSQSNESEANTPLTPMNDFGSFVQIFPSVQDTHEPDHEWNITFGEDEERPMTPGLCDPIESQDDYEVINDQCDPNMLSLDAVPGFRGVDGDIGNKFVQDEMLQYETYSSADAQIEEPTISEESMEAASRASQNDPENGEVIDPRKSNEKEPFGDDITLGTEILPESEIKSPHAEVQEQGQTCITESNTAVDPKTSVVFRGPEGKYGQNSIILCLKKCTVSGKTGRRRGRSRKYLDSQPAQENTKLYSKTRRSIWRRSELVKVSSGTKHLVDKDLSTDGIPASTVENTQSTECLDVCVRSGHHQVSKGNKETNCEVKTKVAENESFGDVERTESTQEIEHPVEKECELETKESRNELCGDVQRSDNTHPPKKHSVGRPKKKRRKKLESKHLKTRSPENLPLGKWLASTDAVTCADHQTVSTRIGIGLQQLHEEIKEVPEKGQDQQAVENMEKSDHSPGGGGDGGASSVPRRDTDQSELETKESENELCGDVLRSDSIHPPKKHSVGRPKKKRCKKLESKYLKPRSPEDLPLSKWLATTDSVTCAGHKTVLTGIGFQQLNEEMKEVPAKGQDQQAVENMEKSDHIPGGGGESSVPRSDTDQSSIKRSSMFYTKPKDSEPLSILIPKPVEHPGLVHSKELEITSKKLDQIRVEQTDELPKTLASENSSLMLENDLDSPCQQWNAKFDSKSEKDLNSRSLGYSPVSEKVEVQKHVLTRKRGRPRKKRHFDPKKGSGQVCCDDVLNKKATNQLHSSERISSLTVSLSSSTPETKEFEVDKSVLVRKSRRPRNRKYGLKKESVRVGCKPAFSEMSSNKHISVDEISSHSENVSTSPPETKEFEVDKPVVRKYGRPRQIKECELKKGSNKIHPPERISSHTGNCSISAPETKEFEVDKLVLVRKSRISRKRRKYGLEKVPGQVGCEAPFSEKTPNECHSPKKISSDTRKLSSSTYKSLGFRGMKKDLKRLINKTSANHPKQPHAATSQPLQTNMMSPRKIVPIVCSNVNAGMAEQNVLPNSPNSGESYRHIPHIKKKSGQHIQPIHDQIDPGKVPTICVKQLPLSMVNGTVKLDDMSMPTELWKIISKTTRANHETINTRSPSLLFQCASTSGRSTPLSSGGKALQHPGSPLGTSKWSPSRMESMNSHRMVHKGIAMNSEPDIKNNSPTRVVILNMGQHEKQVKFSQGSCFGSLKAKREILCESPNKVLAIGKDSKKKRPASRNDQPHGSLPMKRFPQGQLKRKQGRPPKNSSESRPSRSKDDKLHSNKAKSRQHAHCVLARKGTSMNMIKRRSKSKSFNVIVNKAKKRLSTPTPSGPLLISSKLFKDKKQTPKIKTPGMPSDSSKCATKKRFGASANNSSLTMRQGEDKYESSANLQSRDERPGKSQSPSPDQVVRKRGRPRKSSSESSANLQSRDERPSKSQSPSPDQVVRKRGRPRKSSSAPEIKIAKEISSKSPTTDTAPDQSLPIPEAGVKRKRGRPRKTSPSPVREVSSVPRKRGRPRKASVSPIPQSPKKRGRPRKQAVVDKYPKYPSVPLPITDNLVYGPFAFGSNEAFAVASCNQLFMPATNLTPISDLVGRGEPFTFESQALIKENQGLGSGVPVVESQESADTLISNQIQAGNKDQSSATNEEACRLTYSTPNFHDYVQNPMPEKSSPLLVQPADHTYCQPFFIESAKTSNEASEIPRQVQHVERENPPTFLSCLRLNGNSSLV